MDTALIKWVLQQCPGLLLLDDHFVYTSDMHGDGYFNKDVLLSNVTATDITAMAMAELARSGSRGLVDAVVVPQGAVQTLCQPLAKHLSLILGRPIIMAYADKNGDGFVLRRGYDQLIKGLRVVIADDVLTTGKTTRALIEAVCPHAQIVGGVVIANRGGIHGIELGIPFLGEAISLTLSAFDEQQCPLCRIGRTINRKIGHGNTYVEQLLAAGKKPPCWPEDIPFH